MKVLTQQDIMIIAGFCNDCRTARNAISCVLKEHSVNRIPVVQAQDLREILQDIIDNHSSCVDEHCAIPSTLKGRLAVLLKEVKPNE